MTEKKKKENKEISAKEIAEIMVENMKANMEDPEFWERRERIRQEAANEVLKKHPELNKNKE